MSEKRFFTKINNKGRLVIIDKECHTELFDMTLACEVLNRLDLKLKHYNEVNGEQQATIQQFEEYVFSDERILCYNCLFCQEKDIYEVKCKIKGSVDVHGTCQYYEKKGDE